MNKSAPARRPTSVGGSGKPEQFKLVLLGESAVGKSSMALRFVNGRFSEFQENTIGAAYLTKTVFIDDDAVKFEIWDTAGQERYHSLAPMYYRGAKAAIIVYDITSTNSFSRAKEWVQELRQQVINQNIIIALAGNKSDLISKRMVEYEDANAYAEENGLLFMETSAKNAYNVNEIFLNIARKLSVESNWTFVDDNCKGGIQLTDGKSKPQEEFQKRMEHMKKICCNA